MVKRKIFIQKGNKEAVFTYFARNLTFNQYDKLPDEVKEEYLTWSMETFLKEREVLLQQSQSIKQEEHEGSLTNSKLETKTKKWFTWSKISLFTKRSHT